MYIAKTIVQCERFLHAFAVAHLVEMTGEERGHDCIATTSRKPKKILRHAARPVILSEVPSEKRGTKTKDLAGLQECGVIGTQAGMIA